MENNLTSAKKLGQSIWLDYLSRELIDSGELERRVSEGVTGVTTNPAIFEKAINGSDIYDNEILSLAESGADAQAVYRGLVLKDVTDAANILLPVYRKSAGADGFVSLEVSPHLAFETEATINEARDLWRALNQENVMIKVPATRESLPAITRLIAEGININATLLFDLDRYREVTQAFLAGLESRHESGKSLHPVTSVASFFLSRIDTLVDPILEKSSRPAAMTARGKTAIACARLAYSRFRSIFGSTRFQLLEKQGARPQRLLWASTGTKNPSYPDTHYVEPLIGPATVNTLPPATLDAFMDHGRVAATLARDAAEADRLISSLASWGVDLESASRQLEAEGIRKFVEPYDRLLQAIMGKIDRRKMNSREIEGSRA